MAQLLATIFFSGAALAAIAIIVAMIADNLAEIGFALGLSAPLPVLPPSRVRVRTRADRGSATASAASPLRAAA